MIVGTAGHIDHGKSALVQALTGRTMDRLAEERRRGITIDLNFAPLDLGAGRVASVVDVPGHEDLVRTMIAGASGIDVALLVVAADDGIMPQTREHRLVLEQLGVPVGVCAITKADAVDPAWCALVEEEVAHWLADSPVRFTPPIVTSARTGLGVDAVRSALAAALAARPTRPDDLFRLHVDRAFSVAGTGTVVTGTAWSGRARVGDELLLLPGERLVRVRTVESRGGAVSVSEPGDRVALGLAGLEREHAARGTVLVHAELGWQAVDRVDALVTLAPGTGALRARARVRILHGTAEVMARVTRGGPLPDGGAGVVRFALEAPLVLRGRDRFVLRSFSPVRTLGGGVALDVAPGTRWHPEPLAALGAEPDPAALLAALIVAHADGVPGETLARRLGVTPRVGERLRPGGARLARGRWLAEEAIASAERRARALVGAHHEASPSEPGLARETLLQRLGRGRLAAETALGDLERGGVLVAEGPLVRLATFRPSGLDDGVRGRLLDTLVAAGLQPPTVADLAPPDPPDLVLRLLRQLEKEGIVEAVERDRFFHRAALDRFTSVLREAAAAGDLAPAAVRDRAGVSRKYLIPLMEWADRRGITLRDGDRRRLHPRFA